MTQERDRVDTDELFQAVQGESSLVGRVANQVEHLILAGQLKPGDLLPPQSELAARFGVSRTVVREAVRILATKSLLDVRSGSRIAVRSPTAESVTRSMDLFMRAGWPGFDYRQVHEVRRVLEVEIAGLAAGRRTAEDLERMEMILQEAAQTGSDRDRFTRCDLAFHSAIARATQNVLFSLLLDSLADTLFRIRSLAFEVPGTLARALEHHHAILEQIRIGDPEGARRAMQEDLAEAEEIQRQVLALRGRRSWT
jgi:GntR family transcriptional repressor for pyruvate dehydrogenase complex